MSSVASRFDIGADDFLLDGSPFRIISGALHYFRVHPDLWADRIKKAKMMGLNTIETYIAWNAHAPARGTLSVEGGLDLGRFLDLVHAEGMLAIVRPGPYICAEWDGGGLPAWLFDDAEVGIRRNEPKYLAAVAEFFDAMLPIVASRQIGRDGSVVMVQVENEYGAFGSDASYLRSLVGMMRERGITVPLTTIDQPTDEMLENGGLPELLKTGSFGSRSAERLATLRRHQPTGPLMCAEFWNGWFDFWGSHHHTTSVEQSAHELDQILATGASVNLYMFHGGTNFGFTNGANDKGVYAPTVTSYDYDAPLDELGDPGPKYWAFREVIARYAAVPDEAPEVSKPREELEVALDRCTPLSSFVERYGIWRDHDDLPTLDSLGQFQGFALFRTRVEAGGLLTFREVRDRAQIFLDGVPIGILSRDHGDVSISVPGPGLLELLVEDQGRVNYGPRIGEAKGLIGPAQLDGETVGHWSSCVLDLSVPPAVGDETDSATGATGAPAFFAGDFDASPGRELVLSTRGWSKGIAFVNGFHVGRYWSRGPQATLVIPGPILRSTGNKLVVFEQQAMSRRSARFVAALDLGPIDS